MDDPFYVNVRVRINTFLRSINKTRCFTFKTATSFGENFHYW